MRSTARAGPTPQFSYRSDPCRAVGGPKTICPFLVSIKSLCKVLCSKLTVRLGASAHCYFHSLNHGILWSEWVGDRQREADSPGLKG